MLTAGAKKARARSRGAAPRFKSAAPQAAAALSVETADGAAAHAADVADEIARDIAEEAFAPVYDDDAPDLGVEDEFVLGDTDLFCDSAPLTPETEEPLTLETLAADEVLAADEEALPLTEIDEPPPFDPPEEDDEIFQQRRVIFDADGAEELVLTKPHDPLAGARAHQNDVVRATPPIKVFAAWERDEARDLITALSRDKRLARAEFTIERGGLDAVAGRFDDTSAPDLIIVDTGLPREDMLRRLGALTHLARRGAKIVVVGAVNDINLLRDLGARGVSEYVMPPVALEEFVCSICRLYTDSDRSRVIAVIGARGGVGASTIAHNLAWSIAERQQQRAALVDFDLAFGTAAFAFDQAPSQSIADVLMAPDHANDDLLDNIVVRPTRRLQIFSAPASVERALRLDPKSVEHTLAHVRRTGAWVVLDLPHDWTPWVKHTLLSADETVIVASPDLAGLAAAKNMLEALKTARPQLNPTVVLSMVGVPKRPEIGAKEFAEALGMAPALSFAFEPELAGKAAISCQMIAEVEPNAKMAQMIDGLATVLTGCAPVSDAVEALAPAAEEDSTVPGVLQRLKRARGVRTVASLGDGYLARARRAAETQLKSLPKPVQRQSKTKTKTSPALRIATLVTTAMVVVAWISEVPRPEAQAGEPRIEAATPTVAPRVAAPVRDMPTELASAVNALQANPAEGVVALRALADEGYVPAQYRLAKAYELGEGVSADLTVARQWTERAAMAGEPRAMHDLAVYFARGEGGVVDASAAFRWFRRAASHGIADSQYNLGILYEQGRGVSQDTAEALFWFELAASAGDAEAAARAQAIAARLTPMHAEQARARAAAFRANGAS